MWLQALCVRTFVRQSTQVIPSGQQFKLKNLEAKAIDKTQSMLPLEKGALPGNKKSQPVHLNIEPEKVLPKLESIKTKLSKISATLPTSSKKTKGKEGQGDSSIHSKLANEPGNDPELKSKDQIENAGQEKKETTDRPKRSSSPRVHAFYYPWYGNPQHDGRSMPWYELSASRFVYGEGCFGNA